MFISNKEKIKALNVKWRNDNKEKIKELNKKYQADNKEKIKELNKKYKQKHKCICGSIYQKNQKTRHEKTKKHLDYLLLN